MNNVAPATSHVPPSAETRPSAGDTPSTARQPTGWDTFRARVMFLLAFVFLLVLAGLVHRATSKDVSRFELTTMSIGIFALWPVIAGEAIWAVRHRDRSLRRGPVVWRAVLVCLLPPWRMGLCDPRIGMVWLPTFGWRQPGKDLFKRLELTFSGPMLIFTLLILPILALEFFWPEGEAKPRELVLGLDIGIAVIWVAFATELVLMSSIHPKPWTFVADHWLDVAIVVLPMLEFVLTQWVDAAPVARLLRLGRALSPEQLARMERLYRLRGVVTKGWRAVLLLRVLARLLGQTPEKQLARLEEKIAEMEEELAELRKDAENTRATLAGRDPPRSVP